MQEIAQLQAMAQMVRGGTVAMVQTCVLELTLLLLACTAKPVLAALLWNAEANVFQRGVY